MTRRPRFSRLRSAFTLIELLTVIAIIAILAAILIPVVGAARDSARTAKCVGNLRSTGTGMLTWISETDYILSTFSGGTETVGLWTRVLRDSGYYGRQSESLLCPSWAQDRPWHDWDSYGLNFFDPNATRNNPSDSGGPNYNRYTMNFNSSDIIPSRYILMADSYRKNSSGRQVFRLLGNSTTPSGDGSIHLRHNDRANVFFLDGHIELIGADRLGRLEPTVRSGHDIHGNAVIFPQE